MSLIQKLKRSGEHLLLGVSVGLCSFAANASSTGLPWESP